ncbi:MAG: hypothetical protein ACM37W_25885 [Actinomycetota bacterium]
MLSEKIALKKSLIEALTEQLRIEKTELKRLEAKQNRLSEFFVLQGSLLDDPDTRDSLTSSLHTPEAIAPRIIEISEVAPQYELRLIDIEGDELEAIAPQPAPSSDVPSSGASIVDVPESHTEPSQPVPSLDESSPLDEVEAYRRQELYRQIEKAMKTVGMRVKEGRATLEIMFGNGIISRDQLNIEQLKKFLAYLDNQHTGKIEAIANTITVEWTTENSGITIDEEGEVRPFTCSLWYTPNPEFTLTTSEGKEIKSTWNNKGIEANPHFKALQKSLHSHFINRLENAGYILESLKSDSTTREFVVWVGGQKIGQLKQHLASGRFIHSLQIQPDSIYAPQFTSPLTCLDDLQAHFKSQSIKAS